MTDDRIEGYLEGTVDRSALTPDEKVTADLLGRVIDETASFVDGRPVPDFTASVMREIQSPGKPVRKPGVLVRFGDAMWTRRRLSFDVRPAYGLLAAAALVALAAYLPNARPMAPAGAADPRILVQFRLQAANASEVRLAGSFSNWQPQHALQQVTDDTWTVTLPLQPGVYDYAFVVDGNRWVADPHVEAVDDGFGGTNNRIALVLPQESQL